MNGIGLEDLARAIDRRTVVDGVHETALPRLTLYRRSAPTEATAVVSQPSLCVIAQGCKVVRLADKAYQFDPARYLLASVDLPVSGEVTEASPSAPYLALKIRIDPAVVGELLADGAGPNTPATARGLAVSPVAPPLLDAVRRLVALLDTPGDLPALAPLILREITYRVLTGEQGHRLRQIASVGAPAQRVARAIRWLIENYAGPLRVEALAKHVSMSPSAFHLHFKAVTAMSPLQYQKFLRLQEARRLMLGEGLDAASAAFRVGYESPSQFSREYRRQFGSPPRRDVEALKVEPLPA